MSIRMVSRCIRWIAVPFALLLGVTIAVGREANPLEPVDRSSPRAAIKTFLDSSDEFAKFLAGPYRSSPSRSQYERLIELAGNATQGLDMSEVPPAARPKVARAAATALYEILSRIPLPPHDQIPDADQMKKLGGADAERWVIPHTEIALVRVKSGPQAGEFLFSADTVASATEFYERVRGLPYARHVPMKNVHDALATAGGWMIPYSVIQAMPASLRETMGDQSRWKWIGLVLILGMFGLLLAGVYQVSLLVSVQKPFLQALVRLAMPFSILLAMPAVAHLALDQLILVGSAGSFIELVANVFVFLAGAWTIWRLAPVVAEAVIASRGIEPDMADAYVMRAGAGLLGFVGAATLLAVGADRFGVSVYGLVAGLGVGGLAVALALQPTIENLIGGISLYVDKPVRIGDLCLYGDAEGTVEKIGRRSTQIRAADRTVTTIPNAALSKMPIVNLTRRDRRLIQTVLRLRGETTPQQLRYVLVRLSQTLLGNTRVDPDSASARFIGFGESSLDIELIAYVMTRDAREFQRIREDLLLRVMDVVEQAGTALAFPSQTLYLGRDRGTDESKTQAAEASMQEWQDKGSVDLVSTAKS